MCFIVLILIVGVLIFFDSIYVCKYLVIVLNLLNFNEDVIIYVFFKLVRMRFVKYIYYYKYLLMFMMCLLLIF